MSLAALSVRFIFHAVLSSTSMQQEENCNRNPKRRSETIAGCMSKDIGGSSDKVMCAISFMNSVMVGAVFNGRAIMRLRAQPRQADYLQAKCFRYSTGSLWGQEILG